MTGERSQNQVMSGEHNIRRREFLASLGAGSAGLLTTSLTACRNLYPLQTARPNFLWISAEDISPMLGCYGDDYAITPNLDALAGEGLLYRHAYTPSPVCSPSRTAIITGMYPMTLGAHHHRSSVNLPDHIRCFTEYLRNSGYYCSNCVKEDYNFVTPKTAWDDSSHNAHWRNRAPGQPFFSVFNFGISHESVLYRSEEEIKAQTRRLSKDQFHDPGKAPIPAYHPDVSVFRKEWALYYDSVTALDYLVRDLLRQLEQDGLADNTIVMFWSDHGTGMARCKRWLYESGTRVPLIIRFPDRQQHLTPAKPGSVIDRLVSLVDLAPTVLSLADVEIPKHMQGKAFLGRQATTSRKYVFGFRDRLDERYDCIRAVRDHRYRYIRNFNPQVPYDQLLNKAQSTRAWRQLANEGKLDGPPALFMRPTKPVEELYDVREDPDEVNNLVNSLEHEQILKRLRCVLYNWILEIRDLGFLDEPEMHFRAADLFEFDLGHDSGAYRLPRILETADLARQGTTAVPDLRDRLKDSDSAVRYWAAVGLGALKAADDRTIRSLANSLNDPSPSVRLAVAEALCRAGRYQRALPVLVAALEHENEWVRLRAGGILDIEIDMAGSAIEALRLACHDKNPYVRAVATHAVMTSPLQVVPEAKSVR